VAYSILRRYSGHKGCSSCGEQFPETETIKEGLTRAQAVAHVGRSSSHGEGWYDTYVEDGEADYDPSTITRAGW
jgi:hypothetical protein